MTSGRLPLEGQVALVTGASRGVGRDLAIELARSGADVVVTSRSTNSSPGEWAGTIEETASQVEALGRRALAAPADLTDDEQVRAMTERTLEEFGRVDILVNNAMWIHFAPFYRTSIENWDKQLNLVLRGAVLCVKAFLPGMMERKSGRILNISSGAAAMSMATFLRKPGPDPQFPPPSPPLLAAYAVSKAALEKLTEVLAGDFHAYGIAVNALRLGQTATEAFIDHNPGADLSKVRTSRDAALAALWMITRDRWYTGQIQDVVEVDALMRDSK